MVPSFWAFQQRVNVPGEVAGGVTASIPVVVRDSTISLGLPECQHPTNGASVACSLICAGVDGDGRGLAVFSNDSVGGREGGAADMSLSVEAVFATPAGDGCGVELTLPMPNRRRPRFSVSIDFPMSRHDQAVCAYHHRNVVETARRIAFGVPEQNSQFQ